MHNSSYLAAAGITLLIVTAHLAGAQQTSTTAARLTVDMAPSVAIVDAADVVPTVGRFGATVSAFARLSRSGTTPWGVAASASLFHNKDFWFVGLGEEMPMFRSVRLELDAGAGILRDSDHRTTAGDHVFVVAPAARLRISPGGVCGAERHVCPFVRTTVTVNGRTRLAQVNFGHRYDTALIEVGASMPVL